MDPTVSVTDLLSTRPMAASAIATQGETNQNTKAWQNVSNLPLELSIDLTVPGFTVGRLTELAVNDIVDSHWSVTEDVPLRVNGELVAWSEFEVLGNRLAVRVTELA